MDTHTTIDDAEQFANLCKAAADSLRLTILKVLSRNSYGVLELCKILGHKQSGLSHHLKVLANGGLVETRREGNSIYYRRASLRNDKLFALKRGIFDSADLLGLAPAIAVGIDAVHKEREYLSQRFFETVDAQFNEHQERIADYATYSSATLDLIDQYRGEKRLGAVLEIGPGEGLLLNELAERSAKVFGLDTSTEMLVRAKTHCKTDAIELVHGDIKHPAIASRTYSCIVAMMVLHHVPAPAELIGQMAERLQPGGALIITDLCDHDQAWTETLCGDRWMGFETEQLNHWATAAGLAANNSTYLAQRNGFQIQAHQFIKPNNGHS